MQMQLSNDVDRRGRKRYACQICNRQVIESSFQNHRIRCQFFKNLGECSSKLRNQQGESIMKQQRITQDLQQNLNPSQTQEKLQKMYKILKKRQQPSIINNYNENLKKHQQIIKICSLCQEEFKSFNKHELECSKHWQDCQFCGQQMKNEEISNHHLECFERGRIKRFELLNQDSQEQSNQENGQSEESESNLEVQDYDENSSQSELQLDNEEIYESIQSVRAQIQLNNHIALEQRVTNQLNRYGYGTQSILMLRENPHYYGYLTTLHSFMRNDFHHQLSQGMTEYEISKLQIKKYIKREGEEDTCAICCEEIQNQQIVIKLLCSHFFHSQCIKKWLSINFKCPMCKGVQVSRTIEINK